MLIQLPSTTREKLPVEITTTADPTGALPEFAVTTTSDSDGATWVDGEWDGAWSTSTGKINAKTPLVGAGQALDLTVEVDYYLHARWVIGTEQPEDLAGRLRVT